MSLDGLLDGPLEVVNVGLEAFAEALEAQGVHAVHVHWRPPAGDARVAALLLASTTTSSRRARRRRGRQPRPAP